MRIYNFRSCLDHDDSACHVLVNGTDMRGFANAVRLADQASEQFNTSVEILREGLYENGLFDQPVKRTDYWHVAIPSDAIDLDNPDSAEAAITLTEPPVFMSVHCGPKAPLSVKA